MGVRDRLEDALLLWEKGRKDGAWILVLIAAAATSRQRFPNKNDGDAFREFIRQVTPTIVDGSSPPKQGGIHIIFEAGKLGDLALDEVMYKHLRCYLVHEAATSPDVYLSESRVVDGKLVGELRVASPLALPDFWVLHLAKAVAEAPENSASCRGLFR